jgi:hypothetical protein
MVNNSSMDARNIIELSGARWVGVQQTSEKPLVMFCDPVSGSCLALEEDSLTVDRVREYMCESREQFGVAR